MHANFAAVQIIAVLIFLASSVSSKLQRQSHRHPESNFYLGLPVQHWLAEEAYIFCCCTLFFRPPGPAAAGRVGLYILLQGFI